MLKILQKFLFLLIAISYLSFDGFAQQKQQAQGADLADDGIPVIIKNLPEWETAQKNAVIALNPVDLQRAAGNRPILNEFDFVGGTESAVANYNGARLVLIEFATPQAAVDADARIKAKLGESPQTVYRKVGNYAVFVFDAPNEATANSLIDKITYGKVVKWLSDDPNPVAQAQRDYVSTAGDVIVTVIKASGIAALSALAFGGLIGAAIFYRRRREQDTTDRYTDAGGMLRLNLDELTPQTDAARLLEEGRQI